MQVQGVAKGERAGRSDEVLKEVGLKGLEDRLPSQLSGGQQQRVAIARALLHRPRLVLADEPTGNLDETTSHAVIQLLIELTIQTGSSLLMVTHSQEMASYMDSHWRLHDGALTNQNSRAKSGGVQSDSERR